MEALSNPAISLPQLASMARASTSWTFSVSLKKQASSCSFLSIHPKASGCIDSKICELCCKLSKWIPIQDTLRLLGRRRGWSRHPSIQVNTNSGYLKVFGEKEGTKQASTCTRHHSYLLSSIQLHQHQKKMHTRMKNNTQVFKSCLLLMFSKH